MKDIKRKMIITWATAITKEENELLKYHRSVLEAKIYFGNNFVCGIVSETIENSAEYVNQSDKTVKQDCESKAFVRLAAKIKKEISKTPNYYYRRLIVC